MDAMGRGFRFGRLTIVSAAMLAAMSTTPEARTHGRESAVPAMVARVMPSVVSITTRQIEKDQFNREVSMRGLGSGVIVDRRGYILTNNHVIAGAAEIKVTLPDERAFRAALVGRDPLTDLALIKIDGDNLPVAPLGNSGKLSVGQTVVAIGNPLWIEGGPTVTVGVVSALGRSMEQPDLPSLHDLIQTDAAINAGNSGGPLLNLAGEVIGINTASIASAHGIGFAISMNSAKPVLTSLMAAGRVSRSWLDIVAVSLTPQVAFANDLPIERGALVVRVEPGSSAEAAGFQPDDVITIVAGESVRDLHHFHEAVFRHKPGETVVVTVWRNGQTLTLRAVLRGTE